MENLEETDMARMSYGAPGKGGPARGSWGDSYLIERPNIQKRVSCGTCTNYCKEDKSCNVSAVYPPVDGYDYWKRCDKFDLDIDYDNEANREKVRSVKGYDFFRKKDEETKKTVSVEEPKADNKSKQKQHNKGSQKNSNKIEEKKYEKLLKPEWQAMADDIQTNLYLLAFEKRLHLYPILDECEWIMQNDFTVNKSLSKELDNSLIFMAMVLEKIGCSLNDVVSLSESHIQKILTNLFDKELKYSSPDDVYAEENEKGEDNLCLEFRLYDYFENIKDNVWSMNNVYVHKVLNDDGKYIYVVELYISHIGIDNRKVQVEKLKYSYPNYQFYVAEGDEESYIAEFFEKIYKDVDKDSFIRE